MNANIIIESLPMLFIGCSGESVDRGIQLLDTDGNIDLINALDGIMRLLHGRIRMLKRSAERVQPIGKSNGKILNLRI
jgi:hypothetical protein